MVKPVPTLLVDIWKFRGMPSQSVVIDGLALEKTPDPYPLAHIPGVAVGGHTAAGSRRTARLRLGIDKSVWLLEFSAQVNNDIGDGNNYPTPDDARASIGNNIPGGGNRRNLNTTEWLDNI